jgi:hypothetical protein
MVRLETRLLTLLAAQRLDATDIALYASQLTASSCACLLAIVVRVR